MPIASNPVRSVSQPNDAHSSFARFPTADPRPVHQSLREMLDRRMAQWMLAYLAGAWLVLQMVDVLKDIWDWPLMIQRAICVTLGVGLVPALVVSWYHGRGGVQRVTGMEVLLVCAILFASGAVAWKVLVT
jgi:hypothetical protein